MKIVLIVNKYMAPPKYSQLPIARPYPAVHKGGINAVAMATPKITEAIVPFLVLAIIKAKPPKNAIRTSRISGRVLPNNSELSSLKGNNQNYEVDEGCGEVEEGCGEVHEGEPCEQCGSEMSEGECVECGAMYEKVDTDLHESFDNERKMIREMFNRFNKFN